MMREDDDHSRVLFHLRAQYWDSLPTKAYRVRRLIRKERKGGLELGEREELELAVRRLAESGACYGFEEISDIAVQMVDLLDRRRDGDETSRELEVWCDELDRYIDDMTVEALAVGLKSIWRD